MKNKSVIIIIFFAFSLTIYSQQSEKYLELTKNLKPIDSVIKIKKYRNGKTKQISKFLVYENGEYNYDLMSDKQQLFNKKGELIFEQLYDSFGILLYQKQFNEFGEIYKIIETNRIELKKNISVEELFTTNKNIIIESFEKEFNNTEKGEKLKLWKAGKRLNGKKIGEWKIYNLCDNTSKIKKYKDN
ncbi:hypothetical protein [uncultured Polaribacter sp.]|uniref:hypothetical protein n=1 Tax=uncultured Polaribacter sp. TaxID=174711 RepID=UPI00262B79F0|nr:hypothetical protein [uncultured Polaribacter sp.]